MERNFTFKSEWITLYRKGKLGYPCVCIKYLTPHPHLKKCVLVKSLELTNLSEIDDKSWSDITEHFKKNVPASYQYINQKKAITAKRFDITINLPKNSISGNVVLQYNRNKKSKPLSLEIDAWSINRCIDDNIEEISQPVITEALFKELEKEEIIETVPV